MTRTASILVASLLSMGINSALADRVGGAPKANFQSNELTIPCVQVSSLSPETEGLYFDIVLTRQGSSFNYALTAATPEDATMCTRVADFSRFEDDDYDDDESDDDDDSDDNSDDSSDDSDDDSDDSSDDDPGRTNNSSADILVQCEVRSDRSKISVKGKDLMSGEYFVTLQSGSNSIDSESVSTVGDEFEVDFDSEEDDIVDGAEPVEQDFIVGGTVTASIFLDDGNELVASDTANCRIK